MAAEFVTQPDGKIACYSTQTMDFTHMSMSLDDAVDVAMQNELEVMFFNMRMNTPEIPLDVARNLVDKLQIRQDLLSQIEGALEKSQSEGQWSDCLDNIGLEHGTELLQERLASAGLPVTLEE